MAATSRNGRFRDNKSKGLFVPQLTYDTVEQPSTKTITPFYYLTVNMRCHGDFSNENDNYKYYTTASTNLLSGLLFNFVNLLAKFYENWLVAVTDMAPQGSRFKLPPFQNYAAHVVHNRTFSSPLEA